MRSKVRAERLPMASGTQGRKVACLLCSRSEYRPPLLMGIGILCASVVVPELNLFKPYILSATGVKSTPLIVLTTAGILCVNLICNMAGMYAIRYKRRRTVFIAATVVTGVGLLVAGSGF